MDQPAIDAVFDDPTTQRLFERTEVARLAYSAEDGSPRVVPVGFVWRPPHLVTCTVPNAAKVRALRVDHRVAVSIDTTDHPPLSLLVRGTAELDDVDGVPQDYLDSNRLRTTPQEYAEWEAGVRSLFDAMVRIVITPTWAKVLDHSEQAPSAVEEIARRKSGPGAGNPT